MNPDIIFCLAVSRSSSLACDYTDLASIGPNIIQPDCYPWLSTSADKRNNTKTGSHYEKGNSVQMWVSQSGWLVILINWLLSKLRIAINWFTYWQHVHVHVLTW